ncbi:MAG: fimbrillin family protein [Tannerellaceae bacterium]
METQTKGESLDNSTIENFGVFAYYTGLKEWRDISAFITPNYIYNQKIERKKINSQWTSWYYSPTMFWPKSTEKLSFFAYAPIATGKNTIKVSAASAMGAPTIEYIVPVDLKEQQDLLYARPLLDKTKNSFADGKVLLAFNHALTQLSFQAKLIDGQEPAAGKTIKINTIRFENLYYKGYLGFSAHMESLNAYWTIDKQLKTTFQTSTQSEYGLKDIVLSSSFQSLCKPGSQLLLMPQQLDVATMTIEYTLYDAQGMVEEVFIKNIDLQTMLRELPMGKNVLLNILLGVKKEEPWIVNVEILPWDDKNVSGDFSATYLNLSSTQMKEPYGIPIKVYYTTDYEYEPEIKCVSKPQGCLDFVVTGREGVINIPGNLPSGAYVFHVIAGGIRRVLKLEILPQLPINTYYYDNYSVNNSANCILLPIVSNRSFKLHIGRIDEYWGNSDITFGGNNQNNMISQNPDWIPEIIWSDFDISNSQLHVRKDHLSEQNALYIDCRDVSMLTGGAGGNIVVGVKSNQNGSILWSWHIWITDLVKLDGVTISYDLQPLLPVLASKAEIANGFRLEAQRVLSNNGKPFSLVKSFLCNGADNLEKIVLDRNLGARMAQSAGDNNADTYGLYYKFGVKDPLPNTRSHISEKSEPIVYRKNSLGKLSDGISFISYQYQTVSKQARDFYVQNPIAICTANTGIVVNDLNAYKYWNGVEGDPVYTDNTKGKKTIYDPSPHGWRVPWGKDWLNILTNQSKLMPFSYRNASTNKCALEGFKYNLNDKAFWFACSGDRSGIIPLNGNESAIYWSGHAVNEAVSYLKLINRPAEEQRFIVESTTSRTIGVIRPVIDN